MLSVQVRSLAPFIMHFVRLMLDSQCRCVRVKRSASPQANDLHSDWLRQNWGGNGASGWPADHVCICIRISASFRSYIAKSPVMSSLDCSRQHLLANKQLNGTRRPILRCFNNFEFTQGSMPNNFGHPSSAVWHRHNIYHLDATAWR